jgi:hypothetical protein
MRYQNQTQKRAGRKTGPFSNVLVTRVSGILII